MKKRSTLPTGFGYGLAIVCSLTWSSVESAGRDADFPWTRPRYAHFPFPCDRSSNMLAASPVIRGAALLYNLLLAESTFGNELAGEYRDLLAEWWE